MKFLDMPMNMVKLVMQKTIFVSTVALGLISKRIRDIQDNSKFWEEKYENLAKNEKREVHHYTFTTENIYKIYSAEYEYKKLIIYFEGKDINIRGPESFNNILALVTQRRIKWKISSLLDIERTAEKLRIGSIKSENSR